MIPKPIPMNGSPVDMERLNYITEGQRDNLREIVDLYLGQTEMQLGQIEAAIQSQSASELKALAHSCGGASSTCGMLALLAPLCELERMGGEEQLAGATEQLAIARASFEQIKRFLAALPEEIIPA